VVVDGGLGWCYLCDGVYCVLVRVGSRGGLVLVGWCRGDGVIVLFVCVDFRW